MADLGSDFGGVLDVYSSLAAVSGRQCHAEAILRRWTTPHGSLFYDFDYGHDVRQYISGSVPPVNIIASQLVAEALKDERTQDCNVTVTFIGEALTIKGVISDAAGPFRLTVNISKLTTQLLIES
jgi:hypothetical protein